MQFIITIFQKCSIESTRVIIGTEAIHLANDLWTTQITTSSIICKCVFM